MFQWLLECCLRVLVFLFGRRPNDRAVPAVQDQVDYCIVGLGNPPPVSKFSRHNFGFLAVEHLANKSSNWNIDPGMLGSVARVSIAGYICCNVLSVSQDSKP